jgi:hypothetical protein
MGRLALRSSRRGRMAKAKARKHGLKRFVGKAQQRQQV